MPKFADLGMFEGARVTASSVKITNAGDGLSQAMKVEPVAFKRHDRIVVVLDCVVKRVEFDDGELTGDAVRVHVLKAGNAIVVDRALVAEMLDEQAERVKQAKEDAAGLLHLDGTVKKLPAKPTKARAKKATKKATGT